jgi:hypothetical protein
VEFYIKVTIMLGSARSMSQKKVADLEILCYLLKVVIPFVE